MPKKGGSSLVEIIKGPIGFVLCLFVTLVMAGMAALSDVSTDLRNAVTTVVAFFTIYMIIWVLNYLR